MTTSIEVPPAVCHHCGGTGTEPVVQTVTIPGEYNEEQQQVLARLVEASGRRAAVQRKRNRAAMDQRERAYEDIIVHNAEARRLGITEKAIAEAVGVSRANLWVIVSGKQG